jgi:hypothetical protein
LSGMRVLSKANGTISRLLLMFISGGGCSAKLVSFGTLKIKGGEY